MLSCNQIECQMNFCPGLFTWIWRVEFLQPADVTPWIDPIAFHTSTIYTDSGDHCTQLEQHTYVLWKTRIFFSMVSENRWSMHWFSPRKTCYHSRQKQTCIHHKNTFEDASHCSKRSLLLFPLKIHKVKFWVLRSQKGLPKQQVYWLYRTLLACNVCTEHVCGEYSSCMCLYDSSDFKLTRNTSSVWSFPLVFLFFPLVSIRV